MPTLGDVAEPARVDAPGAVTPGDGECPVVVDVAGERPVRGREVDRIDGRLTHHRVDAVAVGVLREPESVGAERATVLPFDAYETIGVDGGRGDRGPRMRRETRRD